MADDNQKLEEFIVDEKSGSEPLGGISDGKGKWVKYYNTPAKKIGLIALAIVATVAITHWRGQAEKSAVTKQDPKRASRAPRMGIITLGAIGVQCQTISIDADNGENIRVGPVAHADHLDCLVNGITHHDIYLQGPNGSHQGNIIEERMYTVSYAAAHSSSVGQKIAYYTWYGGNAPEGWLRTAIMANNR